MVSRSMTTSVTSAGSKLLRRPNACCKKTCSISGGDFQQIAVGVGGYGFIVSLSGEAGPAYDADS